MLAGLVLGGCAAGPDYQRPPLATPAHFQQAEGWRQAQPGDNLPRGAWWQLYGDPQLDSLVEALNQSNQTVAEYEAQYRQAMALLRTSRGALLPSGSLSAGKTRSSQGTGSSDSSLSRSASGMRDTYNAQLDISWEADVWGKLRRGLQAHRADAQASAADLANMRLSLQSQLVQNYLQLRVIDQHKRLLQDTLQTYKRSVHLTRNQYRAGISGQAAVAQAQTQLKGTEADLVDLAWQRVQYENAIAVLMGRAPADFSLAESSEVPALPSIPLSVPSQWLERRPDIASAERAMIAANARIGVAQTAWYPDLTLSVSGGYSSSALANWVSLPNRFWSLGPQLAVTLFDGGQRSAEVQRTEAVYDQTVAQYRQTVLDGMREVENALSQLNVYENEAQVRADALDAARQSLRLTSNQYEAGMIGYLDVVNVQTTALAHERSVLDLQQSRLLASVQLVAALGGGWENQPVDPN
ncbi:efflux transporter outer membrane subunit [Pseudomonas sp. HR96]|uniref:efflux transporter outer membrane subunit n=1 Tax=Pseudomonas sp. HR96 TaxID=1027966 RepID=UPI002A7586AD|nr:efflux transporter outer membrane subunit [Pseudomonas sp. HR96]WPP02210.1 efflux transporter outer membrane subunit [Pseudomonas sp. HR96]